MTDQEILLGGSSISCVILRALLRRPIKGGEVGAAGEEGKYKRGEVH